jgi:hypothetical protein
MTKEKKMLDYVAGLEEFTRLSDHMVWKRQTGFGVYKEAPTKSRGFF